MRPPLRERTLPYLLIKPTHSSFSFIDQCLDFPREIHITTICDVNH